MRTLRRRQQARRRSGPATREGPTGRSPFPTSSASTPPPWTCSSRSGSASRSRRSSTTPSRPGARTRRRRAAALPARARRGDDGRRIPRLRAARGRPGERHRDLGRARLLLHVGRGGHGARLPDSDVPSDAPRRPLRRRPARRPPPEHPLLRAAVHRLGAERGGLRPRHQCRVRGDGRPEQAVLLQLRDGGPPRRSDRNVRSRRRRRGRVPEAPVLQHRRLPDRLTAALREGQRGGARADGRARPRRGHRDRPAGGGDGPGSPRGRARAVPTPRRSPASPSST